MRHNAVDESNFQRLLGIPILAGENHFQGELCRDQRLENGRCNRVGQEAAHHFRQSKLGFFLRGDRQIVRQEQCNPAAET